MEHGRSLEMRILKKCNNNSCHEEIDINFSCVCFGQTTDFWSALFRLQARLTRGHQSITGLVQDNHSHSYSHLWSYHLS